MQVRGAQASERSVATKRIIFGEDEHIKPDRPETAANCSWTKPGQTWTNSVRMANGKLYYYPEKVRAELCRDNNSPTGFIKVAGGKTGRDCGNAARPPEVTPPRVKAEIINLLKLNTTFTLVATAKAEAAANCEGASASAGASASVRQRLNLRHFLRESGAVKSHLSLRLTDKAVAKARAKAQCESTTVTTTTPQQPTQPGVPGISIQKDFVESFNPDGSVFSTVATQHGDTDLWRITVRNTGNETLTDSFVDTPPQGEVNMTYSSGPLGEQVDGNGLGLWSNVMPAGATDTFLVETSNVDVPCFTNVVDTIDVTGQDTAGHQVHAQAQAYTKEENTGPDCISTPPPGGSGGPGQ